MPYTSNAELQDLFAPGPLRRSCRRITERCLEKLEEGAAERSPVAKAPPGVSAKHFAGARGRTPGTLKGSWQHTDVDETVSPTGHPRFGGESFTMDPVAPHVEWDTQPHLIRPRLDRAAASVVATRRPRRFGDDPMARLRFVDAFGRVRYAREVHHPGTQGKHMMRDSLAELDATWADTIGAEEVARWAREQAGLVR